MTKHQPTHHDERWWTQAIQLRGSHMHPNGHPVLFLRPDADIGLEYLIMMGPDESPIVGWIRTADQTGQVNIVHDRTMLRQILETTKKLTCESENFYNPLDTSRER